jgi:hypothetical protein
MNVAFVVVLVVLCWSFLAIAVSLAVGGMAKARDAGALPHVDHRVATGRMAPPARDEGVRTAV